MNLTCFLLESGVLLICDETQFDRLGLLDDLIMAICQEDLTRLFLAEEHFELIEEFRVAHRYPVSIPIEQLIVHLNRQLQRYLHIVISMSQLKSTTESGSSSHASMTSQQSELLLHRCSVHWFDEWTSDGLHAVASRALESW